MKIIYKKCENQSCQCECSNLSLDGLAGEILEWSHPIFKDGTLEGFAKHLRKEAEELEANPTDSEEMADVFFLLIELADRADVDLCAAISDKLEKNKQRTWQKPDVDGVIEHVR